MKGWISYSCDSPSLIQQRGAHNQREKWRSAWRLPEAIEATVIPLHLDSVSETTRSSIKIHGVHSLEQSADAKIPKSQASVNKVSDIVRVTLGMKGRNVVLKRKYGSMKIVNDGVTVAKEVELEDPVENIGAKLVVAAGANPIQITRGIDKIVNALVFELNNLSKEVEDSELTDVATVSVGNNHEIGNIIAEASKVGSKGVVTLEEGKSA